MNLPPSVTPRAFERLAEIDPNYVDGHYLRGKVFAAQQRMPEAAEEMRRFLDAARGEGEAQGRRVDLARRIIAEASAA